MPDHVAPAGDEVKEAPALTCQLCSTCRSALGAASPRMPWKARARGMWRGPTPAVLENLTFAERAVIQLARLHIQVELLMNPGRLTILG